MQARYKKGYDEGAEQRGGESATQEENPFFEDQDEDLDFDKGSLGVDGDGVSSPDSFIAMHLAQNWRKNWRRRMYPTRSQQ